jgi:hypothetical protein
MHLELCNCEHLSILVRDGRLQRSFRRGNLEWCPVACTLWAIQKKEHHLRRGPASRAGSCGLSARRPLDSNVSIIEQTGQPPVGKVQCVLLMRKGWLYGPR